MIKLKNDLRQTAEYADYMGNIGWQVGEYNKTYFYIKKFPLIGSLIKVQRFSQKLKPENIKEIAKKYRAFQLVLEPLTDTLYEYYLKSGFKKFNTPTLPTKTLVLDLFESEDKILSQMHHKTRYNIKIALRNGLEIKKSQDIIFFAKEWQSCSLVQRGMFISMKGFIKSAYKSFKTKSEIIFAQKNDKIFGGLLLLFTNDTTYYMYAYSTSEGKKLFAPTLLAWEAIKISKRKQMRYFDFEGIFDERMPIKSWKGFTRFKKSFGGAEIEFPLPLSKFFLPL